MIKQKSKFLFKMHLLSEMERADLFPTFIWRIQEEHSGPVQGEQESQAFLHLEGEVRFVSGGRWKRKTQYSPQAGSF